MVKAMRNSLIGVSFLYQCIHRQVIDGMHVNKMCRQKTKQLMCHLLSFYVLDVHICRHYLLRLCLCISEQRLFKVAKVKIGNSTMNYSPESGVHISNCYCSKIPLFRRFYHIVPSRRPFLSR